MVSRVQPEWPMVLAASSICRVYDLTARNIENSSLLIADEGFCCSYAFSGDSTTLAYNTGEKLRVWRLDASNSKLLMEVDTDWGAIAIDANGTRVALDSRSSVKIWDLAQANKPPTAVNLSTDKTDSDGLSMQLRFSSDGGQLISATDAGVVRKWEIGTDLTDAKEQIVVQHSEPFVNVAELSQDLRWLAAGTPRGHRLS